MPVAAILDVDGTLVDSNYQHAIAWYRAFRLHDVSPALWRVHRHIGMGGDQLVGAVAGDEVEELHGDSIRAAEGELYKQLIDEVRPLEGARDLVAELKKRGHAVVLASSAKEDEIEHYVDLLDVRDLADQWTSSADVEATKPEPDLVAVALRKAAELSAVMVGDSVWDVIAAARAEVKTIGVLSGGFSAAELREAGAIDVFAGPADLREKLDLTPLR